MTLIRTAEEIDGAWLADALGLPGAEIESVAPIGTGQMSQSYRVSYTGVGEDGVAASGSVVVKLASSDERSRATGVGLGAYQREVTFYRELRDRIGGPLAECLLSEFDDNEGWFTLVLEDLHDAVVGDQIAGCSPAQALQAMECLARIHAPVFGDLALGATPWLNQPMPLNQALLNALLPGFAERYGERVAPEHMALCERFVASADGWLEDRRPPLGLVHGDFRLDNLLFTPEGCTAVDWQTVGWGPVMRDASYFIAGGLSVEDRREHEESLVRAYHARLGELGVRSFDWDECWREYRRQCFLGIVMTIAAAMITERTDRGDEMFTSWLARNAQMAIDLEATDLLPEPGAGPAAALRPEPEDEGLHEPGPEQLWNESWYFDAIADDGRIGVYHRIGRLPNEGSCLLSTCIVRPGEPAVMLVDATAPLPPPEDDSQTIDTATAHAEQHCEEPLESFRLVVRGLAGAHADHAAPLRDAQGDPVEIELDMRWRTDGVPYSWRLATRYEIPCRVEGTVRVGEETFALSGPGQRDHSWGSRDWWASDWMWSALHLDDGSHTHAVTVPTHPDFGVGYVQADGEIEEVAEISSEETIGADGLIERGSITMAGTELAVEPLAFGALLLISPDGRRSHFPRAMCRISTGDGRSGLGWVEWNRNQPTDAGA
jgi:hypothetical protein